MASRSLSRAGLRLADYMRSTTASISRAGLNDMRLAATAGFHATYRREMAAGLIGRHKRLRRLRRRGHDFMPWKNLRVPMSIHVRAMPSMMLVLTEDACVSADEAKAESS